MSSIEELLPLLEGVREELYKHENVTLKPGESFEWRAPSDGWLTFVMGVCNQKYTVISHDIWVKEVVFSPFTAKLYGFTQANTTNVYCAQYDETNNIYVLIYAPRPPKFFRKDNYIKITAPRVDPLTNAPITQPTVGSLYVEAILITDYAKFRESLKSIFK
jgi:hypothetical protein